MTDEMTTRTHPIELSPATYARIAGIAFLIMTITAILAYFFVFSNFIVPDDAAKTADNIMDSELLFRLAIASWVIVLTMDVVVAWALYVILKPVNKSLALLAAWFRLMMTAMNGAILAFLFIAVLLLSGDDYLTVFDSDQLHALALLFLNAFRYGFAIGYVFLAVHLLILGYLVFQSGYIPRIVGVLLIVASFGYLLSSFGTFLLPPDQADIIDLIVTAPNAIGELSLVLWLLVKGASLDETNLGIT